MELEKGEGVEEGGGAQIYLLRKMIYFPEMIK